MSQTASLRKATDDGIHEDEDQKALVATAKQQKLQKRNQLLCIAACGFMIFVILGLFIVLMLLLDASSETRDTPIAGIDQDISPLFGHKVGLLTNPTGVSKSYRTTVDILFNHPQIKLTTLFAAEHGIRGEFPGGTTFGDYTDELTGLPVYSLYSDTVKEPQPWMLENVTMLVVDLQDVGARCFTYITTMMLCMQAAKQNNKAFAILDRPNPIGRTIAGPTLEPKFFSFVGPWNISLRHGMTMGELAIMFNKEMHFNLPSDKFFVIRHDHWYPDVVLYRYPWIPPSPNINSAAAAVVYSGTVLFEGTNLSLGRGTSTPFFISGAPWIQANEVIREIDNIRKSSVLAKDALSGVNFISTTFVPTASVYQGQTCRGVRIISSDPDSLNSFAVTVAVIKAYMQVHGDNVTLTSYFDKIAGTDILRVMLDDNRPYVEILNYFKSQELSFSRRRYQYLLY